MTHQMDHIYEIVDDGSNIDDICHEIYVHGDQIKYHYGKEYRDIKIVSVYLQLVLKRLILTS